MKKILVTLVFTSLFFSCASKKVSKLSKLEIKRDSIIFKSEKIIYPAIHDTLFISSPCDSLGNLKPFKQTFATSQGKIMFEGNAAGIRAKIDLREISKDKESMSDYKVEKLTVKSEEFKKVVVQDWKLILAIVISVGLNIIFILRKFKFT